MMGHSSFVMKWHKPFILLLLLHVVFLTKQGTVLGSDTDKDALLELKASLSDPYGALSYWNLTNASHCSWFGVTCDAASRVISLNVTGRGNNSLSCARIAQFPSYGFGIQRSCLGSNGQVDVKIMGSLSGSIAKLSELSVLSLPFNELSGEIPLELWSMEKLEVLDLEGNLLFGSLPQQFNGLMNLKILNLGFNDLSGGIPSSLSKIRGLQVLNLAGNQINGSIPGFMGRFSELNGLYLSYNLLTGSIPLEIGDNCTTLEHLDLSGNFLNEGIPKALGNCRVLKTLTLFSNMLDGDIPSELGGLSQLEVLDVSRNNFGGSIPFELGNCTKLSILVLSNLWDPLPITSSLRGGSNRTVLGEYNFYEGTIPTEILELSSLRMVWAPRTTLQGYFPVSWGSCENLEVLNLAQNFFSGTVSDGISNCKNLHFLDLSWNGLRGSISDKIPVPCMTVFDVSGNYLSGSIPRFSYEPCSPIEPIRLYDPSSVYVSYFLRRAQIEAALPVFEDSDTFAVLHDFSSNNFTGQIQSMPVASERLTDRTVYAFLAGNNKLTSNLTAFDLCDRARGVMVNVSRNLLSGQVLTEIALVCKNLIFLDASGNQINGIIPPEIGDLVSLRVLDLSSNSLQGVIPNSLSEIKDLKHLSLAGNNLNGSIPESLGEMNSLQVLDLSSNSLSGEIPKSLLNLTNLTVLLLNNNKLTGELPPELVNFMSTLSVFNVSYNNLSGSLPQNIKCSSFLSNPLICCPSSLESGHGEDLSPSSDHARKRHGSNAIVIASVASAAAILCIVLALLFVFFYTRKLRSRSKVNVTLRKEVFLFQDMGFPMNYDSIVACFNANNCIGSGGFGATYKAEIFPGVLIAIKQLSIGHLQGVQQFDAEVKTLGRLKHPNLVTLLGYYAGEAEMFLIYNYLPGGNLEKFLHERSEQALDWKILYKIALDIASALAYLHDRCEPRILHRDVKPSNILLDEDCNAYLADFGLARIIGNSETHTTTGPTGTYGYVAPEYAITCKVSEKADVYSYGIVLLEMISDKKALDPSFFSYGHGFNIVAWAAMMLREGCGERVFHPRLWDLGPRDELVRVLDLAVNCTNETLSDRPTMKNVVKWLQELEPRNLES